MCILIHSVDDVYINSDLIVENFVLRKESTHTVENMAVVLTAKNLAGTESNTLKAENDLVVLGKMQKEIPDIDICNEPAMQLSGPSADSQPSLSKPQQSVSVSTGIASIVLSNYL